MSSLSSFFKHNKKVIGLTFIVLAVVILLWILLSKPNAPKGDDVADGGVENLSAYFVTSYYTAGQPTLKSDAAAVLVSFTVPTQMGAKATKLTGVISYVVEKGSGKDIPHPTIDNILSQTFLPSPFLSLKPVPGQKVELLPIMLTGAKQKFEVGKTYTLGLSITNDVKSVLGNEKLPNVYGDFAYVDIVYQNEEGPGAVSGISSSLGF